MLSQFQYSNDCHLLHLIATDTASSTNMHNYFVLFEISFSLFHYALALMRKTWQPLFRLSQQNSDSDVLIG